MPVPVENMSDEALIDGYCKSGATRLRDEIFTRHLATVDKVVEKYIDDSAEAGRVAVVAFARALDSGPNRPSKSSNRD